MARCREHRRPTAKSRRRLVAIRGKCGGGRYTVSRLKSVRATRVELLKVLVARKRRGRELVNRKRESERLDRLGPGRWSQRSSRAKELSGKQVRELERYWRGIWGVRGPCRVDHPALTDWRRETRRKGKPDTHNVPITRAQAWRVALNKQAGWKAPGADCLPAFWLRAFPKTTELLKTMVWGMLDGEMEIPEWLVRGRTVMLPKEGCSGRPDQYRPITCLNTTYKLLTGVAAEILTVQDPLPASVETGRFSSSLGCIGFMYVFHCFDHFF